MTINLYLKQVSLMNYKIIDSCITYDGFFKIRTIDYQFEQYQGGMSKPLTHEVFERGDAVVVLPYDPSTDTVLLIEQFRVATTEKLSNPWLLELVAGIIEPNEHPEEVAKREMIEESGCQIHNLQLIQKYFTSPGGCSEQVWLFLGLFDSTHATGFHGLANEGENIRLLPTPYEKCIKLIEEDKIKNGPALIGLQWLMLNHTKVVNQYA